MKEKVYINGDFVDARKAGVSVHDLGLNYSWGLFETMQAYDGKVFLFEEHIKRLIDGAGALNIKSPHLKKFTKMKDFGPIGELIKLNGLTGTTAYIKIIVTKAVEGKNATTIIFAHATNENKFAKLRSHGVTAIIVDEPKRYRPDIKSLNYLPNVIAREEARKEGAYDAIFKTEKGFILEGSATNIFIVRGKRVITPRANGSILPGTAREKVILLANANGIDLTEARIKVSELIESSEAFVTNSIIEIAGLVKVDSNIIGDGKPGEITRRISRLYQLARGAK